MATAVDDCPRVSSHTWAWLLGWLDAEALRAFGGILERTLIPPVAHVRFLRNRAFELAATGF
ncbi:MAG: hypothetical protein H0T42_27545 [Deltaproteobacteria bacterium]|nr:hypothetical protein [Deltaproteobacteria bacterium]